ncbi:zinc-binding dehydrogenase [Alicyclobacillus cycloheptanicus]|uniref:L-erythro-3,5-diaminohexanoate dehydrogenase n=1 Tax=Alicyclobacillus cycloheptanicus TaxID=1457 RepID=A0ABT9XGP2_9BACL|nr:zinc-binding dehydrogenase [Alicyclobacillus cycloheptanicus]MDQ0189473.1 L-erythro-3,5-diaminohexanoate dehydrogenase [Alicyclobacillus cycloheptanicus]WDM02339.1 zinc-binding dehydrogenase [Alicyclobacillus cycloheptanicus]
MRKGDAFGLHRVREPEGVMPQAAWRIDNEMTVWDNEILIDVEVLNIDSASFTQMREEAAGDSARVAQTMMRIVRERGKHHNPVTGSGGMLVGRVADMGNVIRRRGDLQVGDRIATLVSLSLTPLHIDEIRRIDMHNAQVDIRGQAILFESGIYAKMPNDLPDRVALAIFDICGAPAQTARLVRAGDTVVILGASGKSGLTVLRQARLSAGTRGRVVAVDYGDAACERLCALGWADAVLNVDASRPADVLAAVGQVLGEERADVVINCVNVQNTEMASILCAKDRGTVYFFSMATQFTAAALGAEGVGKDVQLMIGNGYCRGHAEHALQLVRQCPELLRVFEGKFSSGEESK